MTSEMRAKALPELAAASAPSPVGPLPEIPGRQQTGLSGLHQTPQNDGEILVRFPL